MFFYEGSWLPIEWTAQHGCGENAKVNCEIVLQVACEDTLDAQTNFRAQNGVATECPDSNIPGGPLEKADPSRGCIVSRNAAPAPRCTAFARSLTHAFRPLLLRTRACCLPPR